MSDVSKRFINTKSPTVYEEKYLVIKIDDIHKHLTQAKQRQLAEIVKTVMAKRKKTGKPDMNRYLVCNYDEPYADLVWGVISFGEAMKAGR